MKYIEIAPIKDSTDDSCSTDLPEIPDVDHEPFHMKVCGFLTIFYARNTVLFQKMLHCKIASVKSGMCIFV